MISPISDISLLEERIRVLEAESAVRHLLNRYMFLCDVPGPETRESELGQLFCQDAVWQGVGSRYALKFGRLDGRKAIVAMLMSYLPPAPHFLSNMHFLSGEQIGPRCRRKRHHRGVFRNDHVFRAAFVGQVQGAPLDAGCDRLDIGVGHHATW